MKRKFTLMIAAAACAVTVNAQVMLNENFTAPFTPSTSGWIVQNNSVPQGTASWFQGSANTFTAFNGGASDYYAVNYQSQGNTAGGISNFLITPTVNLANGGVIQFATRTVSAPSFPDRLQLLYSFGTGTGAIGSGTFAVGTFTGNLLDINPNLTTNTFSTVNNGTVNGYPNVWTVYSMTLSGITGTLPGRFAFRYFVNDGGPNGNNSDYIGIDAVNYTLPCLQPTVSVTPSVSAICSGQSTTLTASGATSYTWAPGGQTVASIAVSPTATVIYTVTGMTNNCPGTATVGVNVTQQPTVAVQNATTCSGSTVVLTASGATNYTWQPGNQNTNTIAVSPTVNTTYTVTGANGNCVDTKTVSVTISSSLGINITASPSTTICSGKTITLTASGAQTYSWNNGATTSSIAVTPGASTAYVVGGFAPPSCTGTNSINITVNASPNVAASSSSPNACTNSTVTLTGSGALSYTWALGMQSTTNNPITLTTGSNAAVATLTLTGIAANGCTASTVFNQTISICSGVEENSTLGFLNINIYPNPMSNELNISGFNGSVEIYNMLGQMVMTTTVSEAETINTSSLPKGVFIVKAINKEGTTIKSVRVVKN